MHAWSTRFVKWMRLDVLKIEHCKTKKETGFYKTLYLYDDAVVTRSKRLALEQAQICKNNLLKFRYCWHTNSMLPLKKQVCILLAMSAIITHGARKSLKLMTNIATSSSADGHQKHIGRQSK
jgi:hypothetical protein